MLFRHHLAGRNVPGAGQAMSVEQHHHQQQELETQGALWEQPPAANGTPPTPDGLGGQANHVQQHMPCQECPDSSAASTAISERLPPDSAQAAAVNAAVEQRVAAWVENKLIPAINSQVGNCCCPELLHLQHAQACTKTQFGTSQQCLQAS